MVLGKVLGMDAAPVEFPIWMLPPSTQMNV